MTKMANYDVAGFSCDECRDAVSDDDDGATMRLSANHGAIVVDEHDEVGPQYCDNKRTC